MQAGKTTASLIAALRKKFSGEGYALLREVGNGTGGHCTRHADALVMSLFPSRGLTLTGFELKQSRTDWLKELKDASKADAIARYCHYWSLVVTDVAIVHPGELPEPWGLWTLSDKGTLKCVKTAQRNVHQVPLDWYFMAAVLRQASNHERSLTSEEKALIEREVRAQEQDSRKVITSCLEKKVTALEEQIRQFERQTGLSISSRWRGVTNDQIVTAMSCLANDGGQSQITRLREIAREIGRMQMSLKHELEAVETFCAAQLVSSSGCEEE